MGTTPAGPALTRGHGLAQVDYVEPSQNQISLKMIPRIDFDRIKARMSLVRIHPGGHLGQGRGSLAGRGFCVGGSPRVEPGSADPWH